MVNDNGMNHSNPKMLDGNRNREVTYATSIAEDFDTFSTLTNPLSPNQTESVPQISSGTLLNYTFLMIRSKSLIQYRNLLVVLTFFHYHYLRQKRNPKRYLGFILIPYYCHWNHMPSRNCYDHTMLLYSSQRQ